MSAPAAMADDAMEIHPGTTQRLFYPEDRQGRDTRPIFDKADVVVEDDFFVGRQPHMPMEPDVGCAYFTDDGKLCIHSKSIGLGLHCGHDRSRAGD
jgi:aldehyde oxidoreductase